MVCGAGKVELYQTVPSNVTIYARVATDMTVASVLKLTLNVDGKGSNQSSRYEKSIEICDEKVYLSSDVRRTIRRGLGK